MVKNCTFYWTDQPLSYANGPYERLNGFMFTLLGTTPPVLNPDLTRDMFRPEDLVSHSEIAVPLDYKAGVEPDPFSEICIESDWLFASSNFYECLAISAVSMRYENDSINLRDESREVVEERLRTGPLDEVDWRTIIGDIYTCHNAVCASGLYGSCRSDFSLEDDLTQTLADFTLELEHMCPDTMGMWNNLHVDDDVAGKGIVVANIIQIALAIMFSAFANILGYFPGLIGLLSAHKQRQRGITAHNTHKGNTGLPSKATLARELQTSRPALALFSTITEFQETQAYLLIAFQIATLVSYGAEWNPVDYFNVRTASFYVTVHSIPVLLIQSTIQRAGMRWWYTFCLTTIVYSLSVTVDQLLLQYNKPTEIMDECRGAEYMLYGCVWDNMPDPAGHDAQEFARTSVKVSHLLIAFLLLDQLAHSFAVRRLLQRVTTRGLRSRAESVLKRPALRIALRFRWIIVDFFAYTTICYYIDTVDLQLSRYFGKYREWSYGSVIALVPWTPVFAKFLYMNILGVVDSVGRRIDPYYHVAPNIVDDNPTSSRPSSVTQCHTDPSNSSMKESSTASTDATLSPSPLRAASQETRRVPADVEQGLPQQGPHPEDG